MTNWDIRFLQLSKLVSEWSKDPSTKIGAAITTADNSVLSVGFNGFPRGMSDEQELYENREEKYSRIVQGEVNALLHVRGPIPEGCTLYTFPLLPCDRCVVQMLQAGIKRFVASVPSSDKLERWGKALEKTRRYIKECKGFLEEIPYTPDTYEPCGCIQADDTHCMYCIKPRDEHRCP